MCVQAQFLTLELKDLWDGIIVLVLVAQSCPALCNPMDCSQPGSSVHGDSPGKHTRLGCHSLLQGIFLTQGSNLHLPHCRQILNHLSYREAHVYLYVIYLGE